MKTWTMELNKIYQTIDDNYTWESCSVAKVTRIFIKMMKENAFLFFYYDLK